MKPMRAFSRVALALGTAPLALALAACGSSTGGEEGAVAAEPVAEVSAPAGSSWNDQVTRTEQGGWLVGNPDAPISLVEYGSLTCPACASFSEASAQQLHEQYIDSGRVNFEFRSVLIHGAPDLLLTRMLECGAEQSAVPLAHQVWSNLDAVLQPFQANQAALQQASTLPEDQRYVAMAQTAGMLDWFAARGIGTEQARQCLSDAAAVQRLAETTQAAAQADEVTGTPTFLLNGNKIEATGWAEVEAALQRAGAR
jgi:protein-disulfide isomerase